MPRPRRRTLLATIVVGGLMVPAALTSPALAAPEAGPAPTAYVVDAETLPSGAGAAGTLDLTSTGGLDWVHVTGDGTDRKDVAEQIAVESLHPATPTGTFGDSPLAYRWSDGRPITSSGPVTTGAVYSYDHSTVGPTTGFDAGYRVSVPAADEARTLTLVGGAWQAAATVTVAEDGGTTVWQRGLSANGSAQVQRWTVQVPAGEGAVVTTKLTETRNPDGNVSLAAVTLAEADAAGSAAALASASTPATMDLTALGADDWLHLDGATLDRRTSGDHPLALTNLGTRAISPQGDNPVRYSWSDGTPDTEQAGTTTGGVFLAASDDLAATPGGWSLDVAAADRPRSLRLVAGVWNAAATVSVTYGGATAPVATSTELSAGGNAVSRLFTVAVPSGSAATVEARLTSRSNGDGNVTLGGVALAPTPSARQALQSLFDQVDAADRPAISADTLAQLDREVAAARSVLADTTATEAALRRARARLQTAWDAAVHEAAGQRYTFQSDPGLVSSFGWEGDVDAPIAYIDGSYKLRDHDGITVTFGVPDIPGTIDWHNAGGYLPAFVSTYTKDGLRHTVQSFTDAVTVGGRRFEIAYSRMTTTNTTKTTATLPVVSKRLVGLNAATSRTTVKPGRTVVRDYAIGADRFGGTNAWPTDAKIKGLGSYDKHYSHMRRYWDDRLDEIADIERLPDERLTDAYKAGYIYTLIIRDDVNGKKELHVGENGYDELFDHDTIGIVSTLLTVGDFTYAKDYLSTLPAQLQYDDAKWKFSWPFALYLQRTGDRKFVQSQWANISKQTHMIETDRIDGGTGIIKKTVAIDSEGYWTVDDWSALAGLSTYRYLAEQLGDEGEAAWAKAEYDDLFTVVTAQLQATIDKYDLDYIPISMVEPNETGPRKDPRDANWASMFLFGQWAWDGYLFGAEQSGLMLDWIDQTYAHGFERRKDVSDSEDNFGGYPHGYYSSAYNAGYGSTALRGEKYRDKGIKAYEFMLDHSQSGPFGWWEGVDYPNAASPWDIDHAAGGGGSNQHMWGQATATKVLFDSLVAQKSDGTVIIGRGAPEGWVAKGQKIKISNYPVLGKGRIGYSTRSTGTKVTIDFTGRRGGAKAFSVELVGLKDNVKKVSVRGAVVDQAAGTVRVPATTKHLTITLEEAITR
ncbi:hypothetical protein SAMN04488544_1422 [Microlunatus sagamiharensis]|uniref:Sugar-binding protein n=1 Tax=Microlunatus sagamiharensis TaxID=546874 RepID=A0A1H2M5J3_9ACTN|nr:sugar-binding protein [Microlunatus sagamiharensis]SDU88372.1 hypothetical protein SAMN04488544_1422 [Microlunatus sagamiharensis]